MAAGTEPGTMRGNTDRELRAFMITPQEPQPLDQAAVLRIERLLAGYIGPIAKRLVKTAAARAASVEELIGTVASELESETDRHEFTQRWRKGEPQSR